MYIAITSLQWKVIPFSEKYSYCLFFLSIDIFENALKYGADAFLIHFNRTCKKIMNQKNPALSVMKILNNVSSKSSVSKSDRLVVNLPYTYGAIKIK